MFLHHSFVPLVLKQVLQLFNGETGVFKRKLKPVKSPLLMFSIMSKRKNAQAKYLGL